ncbi:HD-GYP domain-containing protein [Cohnella soli]|uniref:HD-GYP domain-containing protein n=1 Tax=Cohnella soli TaxID=425005 RepID=A0ABW0HMY1_9BACL
MHNNGTVADELRILWDRTNEPEDILRVINALFSCLLIRDPLTAEHSVQMAHLSYRLAEQFDPQNAVLYFAGSLTHDIGKIGMNDKVLKGSGILTPEEKGCLRDHVVDGYRLLCRLSMPSIMLDIVRYHHERFNGSGYLEGLQELEIPLPGRIAAITDTYSALTTERPYSNAKSIDQALEVMKRDSHQFDPLILQFFFKMMNHQ